MLEPISIPPPSQGVKRMSATQGAAPINNMAPPPFTPNTHINNTSVPTRQQQDLDGLRSAVVRDQQQPNNLNHSSSEDWSDKDGKESMSSPGHPPAHDLKSTTSTGSLRTPVPASSTLQTPRAWMGLAPMATVDEELDHAEHNHFFWSKAKIAFKEPFAEFWGTFILVLFGKLLCPSVLTIHQR